MNRACRRVLQGWPGAGYRHPGVANHGSAAAKGGSIAQALYRPRDPPRGGAGAFAEARRPVRRPLDRPRKLSHHAALHRRCRSPDRRRSRPTCSTGWRIRRPSPSSSTIWAPSAATSRGRCMPGSRTTRRCNGCRRRRSGCCSGCGLEPEGRKFVPHVALARLRGASAIEVGAVHRACRPVRAAGIPGRTLRAVFQPRIPSAAGRTWSSRPIRSRPEAQTSTASFTLTGSKQGKACRAAPNCRHDCRYGRDLIQMRGRFETLVTMPWQDAGVPDAQTLLRIGMFGR